MKKADQTMTVQNYNIHTKLNELSTGNYKEKMQQMLQETQKEAFKRFENTLNTKIDTLETLQRKNAVANAVSVLIGLGTIGVIAGTVWMMIGG